MNPPPYNTHVQHNAVYSVHNLGEPYPPPPPVTTTVAMSQGPDYSFPPPPPPEQLAQLTQERMPSSIHPSGGIPYSNTTVGTTPGFQQTQTSFPPLYQNPQGMLPNQSTWNTGIGQPIGFQMGNVVQHVPAMNYPGAIPPYPVTHHQQPVVIHGGPPPPYPGTVPTYASVTSVYPSATATQAPPYSYSPSAPIATPPYSTVPHLHSPSQNFAGTAAPLPYPPR